MFGNLCPLGLLALLIKDRYMFCPQPHPCFYMFAAPTRPFICSPRSLPKLWKIVNLELQSESYGSFKSFESFERVLERLKKLKR